MGNIVTYYKSQKSPNRSLQVTDTDKAILDLRIARKQLVSYKQQQEKLIERSQDMVGELLTKQLRQRALTALKKKKLHEQQAIHLEQSILKIDEQVVALETTEQQVDTISALRRANHAMKALQQQAPLDAIEKLLQETEESNDYVAQVNTMLNQRLGEDVGDIDGELAALEVEIADEQAAAMPAVPTVSAPVPEAEVDDAKTGPHAHADDLPVAPTHAVEVAPIHGAEEESEDAEATLVAA